MIRKRTPYIRQVLCDQARVDQNTFKANDMKEELLGVTRSKGFVTAPYDFLIATFDRVDSLLCRLLETRFRSSFGNEPSDSFIFVMLELGLEVSRVRG